MLQILSKIHFLGHTEASLLECSVSPPLHSPTPSKEGPLILQIPQIHTIPYLMCKPQLTIKNYNLKAEFQFLPVLEVDFETISAHPHCVCSVDESLMVSFLTGKTFLLLGSSLTV